MRQKSDPITSKIRGEIQQTLESFGYELVQLRLGGRVGSRALTILMDKPGGVTSGDCQYMADRISVLLDTFDPISGHYTLVVSSPGVNRPLTSDADFERFAGQKVSIRSSELGKGPRTRQGVLRGVQDGSARLEVNHEEVLVPLADIEAANILYDWDQNKEAHQ